MKLWQKEKDVNAAVEKFTVGNDLEMDAFLAKADILGSMAHTVMLSETGLMSESELSGVHNGLRKILSEIETGDFILPADVEDIHSYVELRLTKEIGAAGAKIHSGRSRNDQVLVDLKLFLREEIKNIVGDVAKLFETLQSLSEKYKNVLMPGYTHLQVAMPSSFGLWFGAYAESLVDDTEMLRAAYRICNKNPLGSAAGYGSSFPLNRSLTTELLGFDEMNYNVVYAQMGRGKCEKILAQAMSSVAATLSRLAADNCMFMSQNFGFVSYPDEFTTGSSIMPHKKNPDVWELIRGKCNALQALPNTIMMMTANLPIGYNRDLQLLKEHLFPALGVLRSCIDMAVTMLEHVKVNEHIIEDPRYDYVFSVEEVNRMVLGGMPFREAYREVGMKIERGEFEPCRSVEHTHEGSIGCLCSDKIAAMMQEIIESFGFDKVKDAEQQLVNKVK